MQVSVLAMLYSCVPVDIVGCVGNVHWLLSTICWCCISCLVCVLERICSHHCIGHPFGQLSTYHSSIKVSSHMLWMMLIAFEKPSRLSLEYFFTLMTI